MWKTIIAISFLLFIAGVVIIANTVPGFFNFVNVLPYGDKLGHFGLIGTLTLLINLALNQRGRDIGRWRILYGSVAVFIVISLEELSQNWIDSRTFSLSDWSANVAGILILGRAGWWWTRTRYRQSQQEPVI